MSFFKFRLGIIPWEFKCMIDDFLNQKLSLEKAVWPTENNKKLQFPRFSSWKCDARQ